MRVLSAACFEGLFTQNHDRLFIGPGNEKAKTIEQTAGSDSQGFARNVIEAHSFDKFTSRRGRIEACRNSRGWIVISAHGGFQINRQPPKYNNRRNGGWRWAGRET